MNWIIRFHCYYFSQLAFTACTQQKWKSEWEREREAFVRIIHTLCIDIFKCGISIGGSLCQHLHVPAIRGLPQNMRQTNRIHTTQMSNNRWLFFLFHSIFFSLVCLSIADYPLFAINRYSSQSDEQEMDREKGFRPRNTKQIEGNGE